MNILNLDFSLPRRREDLSSIAKRLNISAAEEKIFEKIFGLKYFPIDEMMKPEDLILDAARKCLFKTKIPLDHIKWIVYTHTAQQALPFNRNVLFSVKHRLKITAAHSFSTSMNKCASVFVAFQIAEELFKNLSSDDYILVLTGDVAFTEVMQYIPGTTILSEGACAILLAKHHCKNEIINTHIKICGQFARGSWDSQENKKLFEKNYSSYLAEVINQCVSQAHLSIDDIKLILPHNVNQFSWKKTAKILNISENKIFRNNISQLGHCFGSDPFLNYASAYEHSLLRPNDYFLMATVGLGATFAAMLIQH